MMKPKPIARSKRVLRLEREWLRRFGEPPAITADAPLLARILRETATEPRR